MTPAPLHRACWCGADAAYPLGEFAPGTARLVRCAGCGVLALHPQPSDEQLAAAYESEYYGVSPRKFVAPIAAMVALFQGGRARLVARRVEPGGRILDVGCGNGGFLAQLQRRGYQVEGTERTAESAARVPQGIPTHVGDLLELPLPSGGYDAVTLWHVFEHLRHPRETLARIHALLKPGGLLALSLPNAESRQALRYGLDWFHHDPPRHLFGFGPRSLTRLLEQTGFRLERLSTWSWEQNPYGDVQSAANAAGLPRDRLYRQLKGLSREPWNVRWSDRLRAALGLPRALARELVESCRAEGATMTVLARSE